MRERAEGLLNPVPSNERPKLDMINVFGAKEGGEDDVR
jgi:hypothetical protein